MVENMANLEEEFETPPAKLELGILVLDGSGSMAQNEAETNRRKADAVEAHLLGDEKCLLNKLKTSTRAGEIQLSIITFDHRVRLAVEPTPVLKVESGELKLDLMTNHGGATAIGLALTEAGKVAREFLSAEEPTIPRYAVILLMTDGKEEGSQRSNPDTNPVTVAEAIKKSAKDKKGRPDIVIAAAAYGDDADEGTLRQIVTPALKADAEFYRKVKTGEELREFFWASMSVVDRLTSEAWG